MFFSNLLDKQLGRHIATRTEAKSEAEKIRAAIRDGTFRDGGPVLATLTVAEMLAQYHLRDLKKRRPKTADADLGPIALISRVVIPLPTTGSRPFGAWVVADVTTDSIERFREIRLKTGGWAIAVNRNLALLRSAWNWAIRVSYVDRTPFKRGTEAVVKLTKELPRSRRLEAGEQEALLATCGARLRSIVEGALETGMRHGELLSLQVKQIRMSPRAEIFVPASKAKQKKDRRIPISTRLKAILEMRLLGPDGKEQSPDAFVFGNAVGERVGSVGHAWQTAVLRAHGFTPRWRPERGRGLTDESRADYAAIGLHFHDLRREAASRWLEGGVPLHKIRDWLGHANIAQTSTYLAGTSGGDEDYMRRFEERAGRLQKIANSFPNKGIQRELEAATYHEKL